MASGSIESATIKGRRFPVDAEADAELVLGGFTNETKPNGDGSFRIVKTRKTAHTKGLVLSIDPDRGDMEFLQKVADEIEPVDADFTLVDGNVYSGSMAIVGDLAYKTKEGTCELEMSGTQEKQ